MYYGFHKKIARVGDTSSTSLCKEDSERTRRLVGRHPKGRLGKMLKRQEQNACTMGGEKMHQSGYFKSSLHVATANVTIVLPQVCGIVLPTMPCTR